MRATSFPISSVVPFRLALGLSGANSSPMQREQAWLARGAILGAAFLLAFILWMGLPSVFAVYTLLFFLIGAVGHARVRAMAGAATPWLFPWGGMIDVYARLFGSKAIGARGDYRPFTALLHLKWMDRGYPHSALAAQAESYNMARRGALNHSHLRQLMYLAVPIGLALGWWTHLTTFYDAGANIVEGGRYTGGVRGLYANLDAAYATNLVNHPTLPLPATWVSTLTGLIVTVGAVIVRNLFLRFPFHPAGFVIGMNHGQRFWAPFLIVWTFKGLLLRVGGVRVYRRLMPAFLGIVVGHYFCTGLFMGLAKMTGLAVFENLPIIWF